MKAVIKRIEINNFKGVAKADREFDNVIDILAAENGSGKTTFKNAFLWCLGFNVDDVIPTINNKEIPELEISVTVTMNIDDLEYRFERVQKEVYRVNRDTGIKSKVNNESIFTIDNIEMLAKDYKEKLSIIFGASYSVLPMLVNKEYFNNDMDWKDRRKLLFEISNVDSVINAIANKSEYALISNEIKKGYATADIKKSLRTERLGYVHKQETNVIIMQDKQCDIARYSAIDFDALRAEKANKEKQLFDLQMASKEQSKNIIIEEKTKEINALVSEQSTMRVNALNARNAKKREIDNIYYKLEDIKSKGNALKDSIERLSREKQNAETSISNLAALVFQNDKCTFCGQVLPKDKLHTAQADFEKQKQEKLDFYNKSINDITININNLEIERSGLREEYKQIQQTYNQLTAEFENLPKIEEIGTMLSERIVALRNDIASIQSSEQETPLVGQIKALGEAISNINGQLAYERVMKDNKTRITELKDESVDLADRIALCERKEKALENYVREQATLITETINQRFANGVSFSLFDELYKDGDGGLKETCICMYKGKRYTSMSTGERYFADLEVVKTLQKAYNVSLPIFCDNAESVTIPYSAAQQIIELRAEKGKKLDDVSYIESIL